MPKSLLNLSINELQEMVHSNLFPNNTDWEGLEEHPSFSTLFRYRNNPKGFAQHMLKLKGVTSKKPKQGTKVEYKSNIPLEHKERRLKLKEEELKLKQTKQTKMTAMYDHIEDIKRIAQNNTNLLTEINKTLTKLLVDFNNIKEGKT